MVFLQKKREISRKAFRVVVNAVCLSSLMLMTPGCGKVEEPIPVQLSSGNVEELQNGTAEEKENDTAEEIGQNDSSDENLRQPEGEQQQSVGSAELEGNVQSIGADSIVMMQFV